MSTDSNPVDSASKSTRRKEASGRVRDKVEKAMQAAEFERQREMARKRLELARNGAIAFEKAQVGEGMRNFLTYLRMIELNKGVEPGMLKPALFDNKKELPELLLVTGIYWDLARYSDRLRTKNKTKDYAIFLDKYVLFAKGTSYQPLCAETLRKYLAADKAIHRSDFMKAYKAMGGSNCFVATAVMELGDVNTVPTLRAFRDDVCTRSAAGRAFVRWYYKNGPALARQVERWPFFARRALARVLDALALVLAK